MSGAYPGLSNPERTHVHKRLVSLCLSLMAGLTLVTAPGHAEDKPKKVKYVPPEGFGGHKWGELRTTFDRLPNEPVGVTGIGWRVKSTPAKIFSVSVIPGRRSASIFWSIWSR